MTAARIENTARPHPGVEFDERKSLKPWLARSDQFTISAIKKAIRVATKALVDRI